MKFSKMPYNRVDKDKVIADIEELKNRILLATSGEEQFEIHQNFYKIYDEMQSDITIASIRHTIDVTDEFYSKEEEYNDEIGPLLDHAVAEYYEVLYHSKYREYLEEKIGRVAFKNIELKLKSINEEVLPLMQKENALSYDYSKLIATAKIEFDGQELNLSLMQPYMVNSDRDTRAKAYLAVNKFFESKAEELDEIYDQMVKNRDEQAKKLGFSGYTELGYLRMQRNSYGRAEIERLREFVKTYWVPLTAEIHESRRKRLGVDKLGYIDNGVYFLNGDPSPTGSPEEILETGAKMYDDLSEVTGNFYRFMQENELFDVFGRKTKRAGGYMTYIPRYKAPFIFANFNATSHDMDVITHECGHAFQGWYVSKDPIIEHNDITMETAEIHSMAMEFFTERYADWFFGERGDDYRRQHLEDSICFIPYGCMVDEFQHIVYDNPSMSPEDRKKLWMDLEKQYRPHINYEDDSFFSKGGFWQKQQHIYTMPFYYIDYVLAQFCALQYFIALKEDYKKAFEDYLNLCGLSAKEFYPDMLSKTLLKLPYSEGVIENLSNKLREFL